MHSPGRKTGVARLWELAFTHRVLVGAACLLSVAGVAASFVPFIMIYRIISELVRGFSTPAGADGALMVRWGWTACGAAALAILLNFLALCCSHVAAFKTLFTVKYEFVRHMARLPMGFHNANASGRLRKIVDENIEKLENFIAHQLPDIVGSFAAPAAVLVILAFFDWRLGLAALVPIILSYIVLVSGFRRNDARSFMEEYQDRLEAMNNASVEYVRGISVIKAFNQTLFSFRTFHETIKGYTDFCVRYTRCFENHMGLFLLLLNNIYLFIVPAAILLSGSVEDYPAFAAGVLFYLIFSVSVASPFLKLMYVSNVMRQVVGGMERMDAVFDAEPLPGEKFAALRSALSDMMWASIRFEALAGVFVSLASMFLQVGIGAVVLVGVGLMADGTLEPAVFLAFVLISSKIYGPLVAILTLLPEFFYLVASTERMRALRREPVMEGATDISLDGFGIAMENVTFAYNERDVITNLSCVIPQGTITALVGPSGSGKSTVSRLIARFWDVKSGRVTVGGHDVGDIEPERLMNHMSFVFQDVLLFDDTILGNIRVGRKDATHEEIMAAARAARCEEFILRLPRGWDTVIGENGCTLSGGERQRISIARALLKNAPIVLLDEATASLDPENETHIQAAISELVRGRTVIIIAHRLRTVLEADQVIVLENGRMAECGKPSELLARDGLFARLFALQQKSMGLSPGRARPGGS